MIIARFTFEGNAAKLDSPVNFRKCIPSVAIFRWLFIYDNEQPGSRYCGLAQIVD
jgi:hypothetical protein